MVCVQRPETWQTRSRGAAEKFLSHERLRRTCAALTATGQENCIQEECGAERGHQEVKALGTMRSWSHTSSDGDTRRPVGMKMWSEARQQMFGNGS